MLVKAALSHQFVNEHEAFNTVTPADELDNVPVPQLGQDSGLSLLPQTLSALATKSVSAPHPGDPQAAAHPRRSSRARPCLVFEEKNFTHCSTFVCL